jgi:ribosome-binding protein aMBF1 (putative translation factor)
MEDPESRRFLAQEELIADVQEEICRVMEEEGVSSRELALKLGKDEDFVALIMKGEIELTLRMTADIATALGHHLSITLEDQHD